MNSQWDDDCLWRSVIKDSWFYGGFGYGHNVRPDFSNTQWALMALDAAGLHLDDPTWKKADLLRRMKIIRAVIKIAINKMYSCIGYLFHQGLDVARVVVIIC